MTDEFSRSVDRLRGNSDFEEMVAGFKELMATVTDELVLSKDPNDVLRAQGAVRVMRLLLKELAP
jgi:hypothetical protein